MVGDTVLSVVCKQKYLGVMFDIQLNWSHHVASVCKSMSYYLALIGSHVRNLRQLVRSCIVMLVYTPVRKNMQSLAEYLELKQINHQSRSVL